jgi:hypothetical protein
MGSIAKSHMRMGLQTYAKIRVYKDQSSKQNKYITLVLTQNTIIRSPEVPSNGVL